MGLTKTLALLCVCPVFLSAASRLDGTEAACNTIILGDPTSGYTMTCDYNSPCPGQAATCDKFTQVIGGDTWTTCTCADGAATLCCMMFYLETAGGGTGYVLAGDCDPPNSSCQPGVCQEIPIPTPVNRPQRQQANCVVE